jgi:hypothetical protein
MVWGLWHGFASLLGASDPPKDVALVVMDKNAALQQVASAAHVPHTKVVWQRSNGAALRTVAALRETNHVARLAPECEAWSCTCQGMSDAYGAHHQKAWGRVTPGSAEQKWWLSHDCDTLPKGARSADDVDLLPPAPPGLGAPKLARESGACGAVSTHNAAACAAACATPAAPPLAPAFAEPICKVFWHKRFDDAATCRREMVPSRARFREYMCVANGPCALSRKMRAPVARRLSQGECEARGPRGLVTTGDLRHIWGGVAALYERYNSTLPVDIFVDNAYALNVCNVKLAAKGWRRARCWVLDRELQAFKARHPGIALPSTAHVAMHGSKRYELKLLAILQSCFNDVIFLDADAAPLMDLDPLFDTCAFKETGALFWPDLWGHACSLHTWGNPDAGGEAAMLGQSAWPNHIMWELVAPFSVRWKAQWEYAQEFESGQLVVDKRRHLPALLAALQLCTDAFAQKVLFGDKVRVPHAHAPTPHSLATTRLAHPRV